MARAKCRSTWWAGNWAHDHARLRPARRGALPQSIQPIERLCRDYPWFAFDRDSRSRSTTAGCTNILPSRW